MELDVDMRNVSVARRFVRATLDGLVPSSVVADLLLATSELVTNAFEHGRESPVVVTARMTAERASVSVRSTGACGLDDDIGTWTPPHGSAATGRGLGIVRAVSDHIDVVRHHDTLEVTIHRALNCDATR
jgi:anti-sigma regulatory factor (Ser/Thr protein kinase)